MGELLGDTYTNHNESELFDDQLMLAVSADRLFSVMLEGAAHESASYNIVWTTLAT